MNAYRMISNVRLISKVSLTLALTGCAADSSMTFSNAESDLVEASVDEKALLEETVKPDCKDDREAGTTVVWATTQTTDDAVGMLYRVCLQENGAKIHLFAKCLNAESCSSMKPVLGAPIAQTSWSFIPESDKHPAFFAGPVIEENEPIKPADNQEVIKANYSYRTRITQQVLSLLDGKPAEKVKEIDVFLGLTVVAKNDNSGKPLGKLLALTHRFYGTGGEAQKITSQMTLRAETPL